MKWIKEGSMDITDVVLAPSKRNAGSEFKFLKMCLDFVRDVTAFIKKDDKGKKSKTNKKEIVSISRTRTHHL